MKKEVLLKTAKQIMFNAEMAKAIQDGRKTETRRAINNEWIKSDELHIPTHECKSVWHFYHIGEHKSKYGIGDIVWVREPAKVIAFDYVDLIRYRYLSDFTEKTINTNNRFLNGGLYPKWITGCQGVPNGCIKEMARTFLRITDVRVERLQDMTVEDMISEGISNAYEDGQIKFIEAIEYEWVALWDSTAKDGCKWEDNPFVFVYKLEVVEYT